MSLPIICECIMCLFCHQLRINVSLLYLYAQDLENDLTGVVTPQDTHMSETSTAVAAASTHYGERIDHDAAGNVNVTEAGLNAPPAASGVIRDLSPAMYAVGRLVSFFGLFLVFL